jgi:enoyl-CoA hydratase
MTTQTAPGRLDIFTRAGAGWVVIDNPARRNAMSLSMWRALTEGLDKFAADPAIFCVVLRGAGDKAFCAGADISEFGTARSGEDANREYERITGGALERLRKFDKPTVAVISGFCIGGGLALALACDLRIGASGSTYAVPAGRLGIGYDGTTLRRIAALSGPAHAKRMLYTAHRVSAEEAHRTGLIDEITSLEVLDKAAQALIGAITENAPLSLAAGKAEIDLAFDNANVAEFEAAALRTRACQLSADFLEGQKAFQEKRLPKFSGH